jgi:hypothetical protein
LVNELFDGVGDSEKFKRFGSALETPAEALVAVEVGTDRRANLAAGELLKLLLFDEVCEFVLGKCRFTVL